MDTHVPFFFYYTMGHSLSTNSSSVFNTLHPDLQRIISWALDYCLIDFGLSTGHRTVDEQFELFKIGRDFINGRWKLVRPKQRVTNIDGHIIKGNHNYKPSLAFDFFVHVPTKPNLTWDVTHLTYIAATFVSIGEFMYKEGMISHKVRSGQNWDDDGDLSDHSFVDLPHIELYEP